jgi:peptide methionine sulfoxide reductase MsrB
MSNSEEHRQRIMALVEKSSETACPHCQAPLHTYNRREHPVGGWPKFTTKIKNDTNMNGAKMCRYKKGEPDAKKSS